MRIGVRKSLTRIGPALPGARLPLFGDLHDVAEACADQKTGGDDGHRHACLEANEGGVEACQSKPEIGDTDLILKRARLPAD